MLSLASALVRPRLPADETGNATRIVRKGMFVVLVMFGGFFIWASYAPLSGAVITDGKVKIASNRKTIQHLEGGIVKEILVKDGDVVAAGQPLLRLEDTRNNSEVTILRDQHDILLAKEARLHAEKTLSENLVFPVALLQPTTAKRRETMAKESALFSSRRRMLDDQIRLLQQEMGYTKESTDSYQSQLSAIEQNIKYKQEQVAMREKLQEKNFVGQADVLNLRQSLTDKKEQFSAQAAELNTAKARMSALQLRTIDVKNKYIQEADTEIKEVSKQLFELGERLRPAEDSMNRRTVTAPLGGQVMSLKVTTVGGVVAPGQALLEIVPDSEDLVVEARVSTIDIEAVFIGQAAEVQLNAYNQRTTPTVLGKVTYVSGDATDDPQSGKTFYTAHVKIDDESMKHLNGARIEPGMPATAYIKTADKTMMQYLISPLVRSMRRGLRED